MATQTSFGPQVSGANASNFLNMPPGQAGGSGLSFDGLLLVVEFSAAIAGGVGMNFGIASLNGNGIWEFASTPTNVLMPLPAGTTRLALFITKGRVWGITQAGTILAPAITNRLLKNALNPAGDNPDQGESNWFAFVSAPGAGITSTMYGSFWGA